MKQTVSNVFSGGLNTDTNELTTPDSILTDCLNGTLITYNGKEFTLQNDFGNGIIESAKLKEGFIPIGIKEYGGIVYLVSHNPMTLESEFGSFPSPERNVTPSDHGQAFISQGLSFAELSQNDFLIGGNVATSTIKRDLMKPSDFELNPGDKFAIYFTNESNYNDLLTKLTVGSTRRYYKLSVAKISDSGIVTLPDFNIYKESDIAFDSDNVKYDVYKENSIGTLAIIMQLETIDSFDFMINEKFISADPNNKIAKIKAVAKCSSLVKFKGVKIKVTEVASKSIIYEKYLYLNKLTDTYNSATMEFELAGFEPEKEYSFEGTPFSQFNLYDTGDLKSFIKIKNFVFGKEYATGNNKYETSLFKYYVDESNIKFNFNFNVNTAGVIAGCYMELYDVWSNTSTLYRVNDYVNGLDNYVSLPLINNVLSQTLSATDICGIPISELQTFSSFAGSNPDLLQCKPTLSINSNTFQGDNLISKTDKLRKNHAYIVKLSVIEKYNDANNVEITKYNDVYRYIYTNGVFNTGYFDTSIKNMSLMNYDNIPVSYDLIETAKTENQNSLNAIYNGDHTIVNNVWYPYKIKLQSASTPTDTYDYKTIFETAKDSSTISKYGLNKTNIAKLFGVVNYGAITNISLVNGTSTITEVPSYSGNQSLINNIPTDSNGSILSSSIFVDSDNNINSTVNLRCNTNRSFYGTSVYNIGNLKTVNTNSWVSLYDQLHVTARNNKILVEFANGILFSGTRLGMNPNGYTPEQTTTKAANNATLSQAILSNPNSTVYFSRSGLGPSGGIIRDFVVGNVGECAGFIGKFVSNTYVPLDTSLGARVPENEYILMLRAYGDGYSDFQICPTPFLPEKNQFLFSNLNATIKEICGSIVYVTKGNVSSLIFAPEANDICYHNQFQSIFKTSGEKISYTVQNESSSNIVFLSNGTSSLLPYTSLMINNYINTRAAVAISSSTSTLIFACHEASGSNYTTNITSLIAPKFIAKTDFINIKLDDVIISPELNAFEKNLYQQAKSYALQDPSLVEITTFPESGKLISTGITAKKDEYVKYADLFEWKDNFFNYKGAGADGYSNDSNGDRYTRKCPNLLIDFAK